MDFDEALSRLGFTLAEQRSTGRVRVFRANPNRYLTCWVHAYEDGSALFTWEFAIVDYLATFGLQLGSSEALNTFMFPMQDERGPQDGAWLASAMDGVDATLRAIRLDAPDG